MKIRKNALLCIAISIPLIMLITIGIAVKFYQKDLHPNQNFLYALINNDNQNYCVEQFKVSSFKNKSKILYPPTNCNGVMLYIYNFTTGTSTAISSKEALKLSLTELSEEGYKVGLYCSPSSSIGWWGEYSQASKPCLIKDPYRKSIDLATPDSKSSNKIFSFIAWIKA